VCTPIFSGLANGGKEQRSTHDDGDEQIDFFHTILLARERARGMPIDFIGENRI
jgi:hypothetical protein